MVLAGISCPPPSFRHASWHLIPHRSRPTDHRYAPNPPRILGACATPAATSASNPIPSPLLNRIPFTSPVSTFLTLPPTTTFNARCRSLVHGPAPPYRHDQRPIGQPRSDLPCMLRPLRRVPDELYPSSLQVRGDTLPTGRRPPSVGGGIQHEVRHAPPIHHVAENTSPKSKQPARR